VAEVWVEDHRWLKGDQFDAYMNYPLGFAALSFAASHHRDDGVIAQHGDVRNGIRWEDGPGFAGRLQHALTTYAPEINAVQLNLLGSHDMPRILSICAGDRNAVRLATLVQMTVGGAPCIYYGDEIGLAGAHDPHCRGSFPVDEASWDHEQLAYVSGLTALRHAHRALRRGEFAIAGAAGMTAAYTRSDPEEAFVVCLNAGEEGASLELSLPGLDGRTLEPQAPGGWAWEMGEPVTVAGGRASVSIPARGARLMRARWL
jgi:cyclomaltodextrinase